MEIYAYLLILSYFIIFTDGNIKKDIYFLNYEMLNILYKHNNDLLLSKI